jgi:serine/threonine protein kinase
MLASDPAPSLNQKVSLLGIPNDSIRSGNALDAQKSWVFTRDEISALVNTPGYREFIGFIFGQMTIVFCGISAEDSAAGGFLEGLSNLGLDLGDHFWITDRMDAATHGWAAKAGVAVIRYSPVVKAGQSPDHSTPLLEIFADLKAYVSKDTNAAPLIPDVAMVSTLPSIRELLIQDVDDMRGKLSGYAKLLLQEDKHGRAEKYERFVKEYGPCIHQAWWITSEEPYNRFYDHVIEAQVSASPFSTVWRLRAPDGRALALKVLELKNLTSGAEIESFRRGVQSLGYLTKAEVPGTPALEAAFEIPTSVVMEFVEGENLSALVNARGFDPWQDGLQILEKVCEHLRYGHNLPQGVLHRDVRPSNVMVPYYYWQPDFLAENVPEKHEVKLLNYDLSWHAGAKGQTISGDIEESGYYAPEHISGGGDAARTTLVDTYGVGMCAYFVFTKRAPPPGGSKSTDWSDLLDQGFRPAPRLGWRSAPARIKRLVGKATSPESTDRPMIDQILAELKFVREAVAGETRNLPAEFWAEELISRSEEAAYVTSSSGSTFTREPRPGRTISLESDPRGKLVILNFRNSALPSTNRSGLDRMWSEKLQRAREILTSAGWNVRNESRYGSMELLLSADVSVDDLAKQFDRLLSGLQRGVAQVRIE